MKRIIIMLLTFAIGSSIFAQSEQGKSGSKLNIGGVVFGDYFLKAGGDSTGNRLQYSPYVKDFNAFAFRRINLIFSYKINEKFDTKFSVTYDGPDTLANGNPAVYVRDAALTWNDLFTNSNLMLGFIPTPGFDFISNKIWGYRSIERTIMDQRGILGSRDLGVMLYGAFDYSKDFGYYAMVGNGNGNRNENNKYKKIYGMLFGNFINKRIILNIYSDYQSSGNQMSKTTLSAFVGYRNSSVTIGVENFFQIQNNFNTSPSAASPDIVPYGMSAFFHQNIIPGELKYFVRYDFYNQDINNSSTGFFQSFLTAGLDIEPAPNVHFMPNIWLNAFTPKTNQNVKYTTDVVPRLTFWYEYL